MKAVDRVIIGTKKFDRGLAKLMHSKLRWLRLFVASCSSLEWQFTVVYKAELPSTSLTAAVFALRGIASQYVTQTDPPLLCVAPMCNTKKQKLFDKNTQYHSRWQWIKNAVIHSSILVSYSDSIGKTYFQFLTPLCRSISADCDTSLYLFSIFGRRAFSVAGLKPAATCLIIPRTRISAPTDSQKHRRDIASKTTREALAVTTNWLTILFIITCTNTFFCSYCKFWNSLSNGPTKYRTGHKFSIFCSRLTAPAPQFACTLWIQSTDRVRVRDRV